jgi:hypothetical protein
MAETPYALTMPRTFLTDAPAAAMSAGLTLMSRRSGALADFWRSCAEVRQPTELMALQLNYWTQLVDDYQEAIAQSMSQMGVSQMGMSQFGPPASEPRRAVGPGPAARSA